MSANVNNNTYKHPYKLGQMNLAEHNKINCETIVKFDNDNKF